MVRSAQALVAIVILSGFVAAQQVATHTVVRGDTLWDLAQHYYQNPFEWRRIWESNREKVADPNLIYPHQVLAIPGREAAVTEVTEVTVESPEAPPTPAPPAGPMAQERTVFYNTATSAAALAVRSEEFPRLAVARDMAHQAPWLVGLGETPAHLGVLQGFAGGVSESSTPRGYQRVRLSFRAAPPRVGSRLLLYRVFRTIEDVGDVVVPTGVVTIESLDESGAVGVITREYERIQMGDLMGPLPELSLTPGQVAEPVDEGPWAMIVGFDRGSALKDINVIAFLDLGAEDGIAVGDEFEYVNPEAGEGRVEGRLQVVGVTSDRASARIVQMDDVVFRPGIAVRLARKMR
jgi:LysM repeat protein